MRLVRHKPRKLDGCGKLELERVIGLTTSTPGGLACNGVSEELAYVAGCVIVIYNVKTNCQTHFLTARGSPKPFSCVAFSSQGGKFIAAGELGHQPAVVVWEVATRTCIAEMKAHKYLVSCVQFSPNGKHLVSLGPLHDGYMCLWDWKSGALLMKTRAASGSLAASTLQFATDGSFFVSGGAKHLKQWTIGGHRARSSGMTNNPGMDGRPIKLGSQKEGMFVSLSSASASIEQAAGTPAYQPIYALTSSGVLCLLHCGLAIEKWVDLQVRQAYALATSEGYVACACSDGIVRIFLQDSLEYSATLPRPAPYGYHGLTDGNVGAYLAVGHRVAAGIKFPDAVACTYLQQGQNIAVIYDDHSLYVWDVQSYAKIGRYRTFLSHSSCIWDVLSLPDPFHSTYIHSSSRGEAFATCSADGTIRLWHLDLGQDDTSKDSPVLSSSDNARPQNVYSKDILGVLYIDSLGEQMGRLSTTGTVEEPVDTTVGFRSIAVSPDGNHLAAGDSSGNLRIFDLNSLLPHSFQEAHDAEILSLSYTAVANENNSCNTGPLTSTLLASGGRDRLIHIYDGTRNYDVVETLDDHTASITTVRFACNGSKLLSCSTDKSVVFRNVATTLSGCKATRYHQEIATRGTIYDMDIDASDKLVVTVGQEKKLNILSLVTGKPVRCFKPEGDIGESIKVRMDPTGAYVVCSHSDRCLRIYNFITGEPLAEASGHAEVITGVTFLPDCRRLVSVSGDSCIFVWRLPINISRAMRKRCSVMTDSRPPPKTLKSSVPRSNIKDVPRAAKIPRVQQLEGEVMDGRSVLVESVAVNETVSLTEHEEIAAGSVGRDCQNADAASEGIVVGEVTPAAFKFSVSRLPPWAQAKIALDEAPASGGQEEPSAAENIKKSFQSRWAERLGREGYKLFSEFMEEVTPPTTIRASGFGAKRRFSVEGGSAADSDSTPESANSHLHSSPTSSPSLIPRKESHWTTVHTVFLDDSDFDDISPKGDRLPHGIQTRFTQGESTQAKPPLDAEQRKHDGESADDVKGVPSDDEGEPADTKTATEVDHLSVKSEDEVVEVDEFSPCRDLFSPHFDKLASDPKVGESARTSFSARFFKQSNPKLPRTSPFLYSPAGKRMKSRRDSRASLEDTDISESTPGEPFAAERERPKPHGQQKDPCGAQHKNRISANLDNRDSWTSIHAFGQEKSGAEGGAEKTPKDLQLEGSPQMPDLLPSRSPPLTKERKGSLPPKQKTGTPIPSSTLAKDRLASPAPLLKLQKEIEEKVSDCSEQSTSSTSPEAERSRTRTESTTTAHNLCYHFPHPENHRVLTALTVAEPPNSGDTVSLPGLDGVRNRCALPFIGRTRVLNFQSLKEKESSDGKVNSTTAGVHATDCDIEEPFHSSHWETFRGRRSTLKALPRPVEDYQTALKELMDAANKASMLFDEIYSLCDRSNPTESDLDSLNLSMAMLPPDLVRSGQAFKKLAPECLQVIQKLADKVSTCAFSSDPSDPSDTVKSSDNPTLDFHKIGDYGGNGSQSWPRASGASLGSVFSSLDMESFISRYSETLASQVLALVQKSLPSTAHS